MLASQSIFVEFNLPNATTWFYFSLLLAVALFFKFSRLLSIRNLDVVTLFLLVPGLLLLADAQRRGLPADAPLRWWGYLWLFCGSGYFLLRCLLDLTLVRRPALTPNLTPGGLAWLAGALFVCLVVVAVRQPPRPGERPVNAPAPVEQMQRQATHLVNQQTPPQAVEATGHDAAFWASRILAVVCHLAVVVGLVVVGCRHYQDAHAGMAAATFYLLLPYTAMDVSQWHYVWPMALIVWAVAVYRRPALSGTLLGLASATVYFPVLAFPLWLSFYRGRGAPRFAGAFLLTGLGCLAVIAAILWADGDLARYLQSALALPDWQAWREPVPSTDGFWRGIHWAYRMPVFIAYLALVAATAVWPTPKNLGQVLALTAAVVLGIQFWYADQGGVYVLWYLPLLLLLVFRPNLSDRLPPPINLETDWLHRLGRALGRLALRLLRALGRAAWRLVKPAEPTVSTTPRS
jgi:hypothetical protein